MQFYCNAINEKLIDSEKLEFHHRYTIIPLDDVDVDDDSVMSRFESTSPRNDSYINVIIEFDHATSSIDIFC